MEHQARTEWAPEGVCEAVQPGAATPRPAAGRRPRPWLERLEPGADAAPEGASLGARQAGGQPHLSPLPSRPCLKCGASCPCTKVSAPAPAKAYSRPAGRAERKGGFAGSRPEPRAGELGEEPGVRLRLCGRETRAASTRRGRHAGEQVGGEAGPRLGLRCQERPSEPARQLLQRLRGLEKSTQGSETHRWRGLSHVPSCTCSAFRKSSRRGCGLSPRTPGPLRTHTSVGGWWRHPRPPPAPTHTARAGETQWVDPTPAGAPQDPGTHTSVGVGGWRRCGSSPGPSCRGTGPNGTCSQASRSFSLISPHLRLRLRPYPGESR